jgi:hypothetical protein
MKRMRRWTRAPFTSLGNSSIALGDFIGFRSPEKLWRGQFASRRAVSKRVIMHLDAIVVEPKLSTNVIDFGQNLADPKGSSENLLFRRAEQFSAKKLLKYCPRL